MLGVWEDEVVIVTPGCQDIVTLIDEKGEGTVTVKDGKWDFTPIDQGVDTASGRTVGLDTFVTIDGEPLQHGSRDNLRPFNGEELRRILRVGLCLECHKEVQDPVYQNYDPKRPCPVYREP